MTLSKFLDHGFYLNTCWILGAGASYDAIGENKDIGWRECVPMTIGLVKEIDSKIIRNIKNLFQSAGVSLHSKDIIAILEAELGPTIDRIKGYCKDDNYHIKELALLCLKDLTKYIANTIKDEQVKSLLSEGGSKGFIYCAENYLWLASNCYHYPSWSVITLNYDTVLDRGFEEISYYDLLFGLRESQYDLWQKLVDSHFLNDPFPVINRGVYLKIHGSLDIYECFNDKCDQYRRPFNTRFNTKKLHEYVLREKNLPNGDFGFIDSLTSPSPKCLSCKSETYELILPPGDNLIRGETLYHDMVYREAEKALGRADMWIILGYSCPDYDIDVSNLMERALKHNPDSKKAYPVIWVIAPDAEIIADRITKRLRHPVRACKATFTQLIDSLMKLQGIERPGLA